MTAPVATMSLTPVLSALTFQVYSQLSIALCAATHATLMLLQFVWMKKWKLLSSVFPALHLLDFVVHLHRHGIIKAVVLFFTEPVDIIEDAFLWMGIPLRSLCALFFAVVREIIVEKCRSVTQTRMVLAVSKAFRAVHGKFTRKSGNPSASASAPGQQPANASGTDLSPTAPAASESVSSSTASISSDHTLDRTSTTDSTTSPVSSERRKPSWRGFFKALLPFDARFISFGASTSGPNAAVSSSAADASANTEDQRQASPRRRVRFGNTEYAPDPRTASNNLGQNLQRAGLLGKSKGPKARNLQEGIDAVHAGCKTLKQKLSFKLKKVKEARRKA